MLVLLLIASPVLTGLSHNLEPGLSGTPSPIISITVIDISAPSSYARTVSPAVFVYVLSL